uniref:Uncharacterized protein n=1 Tax=Anguilla anguilla TaxID=7936 RepID=A0A0E9UVJ5_ANGAN
MTFPAIINCSVTIDYIGLLKQGKG